VFAMGLTSHLEKRMRSSFPDQGDPDEKSGIQVKPTPGTHVDLTIRGPRATL